MSWEEWPTGIPEPNSLSLGLVANTQSGGRSPFDGSEQTLELPGSHWAAELRWANLAEDEWRTLQAFIAFMGGRAGRFEWAPPASKFGRRGTAISAGGLGPRVRTTSTGKVLKTTGWAGSGWVMEPGDMFGWLSPAGRPQLAMARQRVGRAGADADFYISPFIRQSPNADEPLILTSPTAIWRLTSDSVMPEYEPGDRGFSVTLGIEEALF